MTVFEPDRDMTLDGTLTTGKVLIDVPKGTNYFWAVLAALEEGRP